MNCASSTRMQATPGERAASARKSVVSSGRRLTLGAEPGRDKALAETVVHPGGVNEHAVPALPS